MPSSGRAVRVGRGDLVAQPTFPVWLAFVATVPLCAVAIAWATRVIQKAVA